MNLLDSLIDIEVTHDVTFKNTDRLVPELIEMVSMAESELSEVQLVRFGELAKLFMEEGTSLFTLNDLAFLNGLYLIIRS